MKLALGHQRVALMEVFWARYNLRVAWCILARPGRARIVFGLISL